MKTKYDDMAASDKDNLLAPSLQLLKFTLSNFKDLSVDYAKKAKAITEKLLKDSQISSTTSHKILEFKSNLTNYEEKYSLCDGIDDLFNLAEVYSNTTSFYYELPESEIRGDTKILLDLLKKYGSEDLDNEFEKHFDVFVTNFDTKFENLKEELKKEHSKESPEVLKWFEDFKKLNTYDDKIEAFEKFFKFYDVEEEENKV